MNYVELKSPVAELVIHIQAGPGIPETKKRSLYQTWSLTNNLFNLVSLTERK